MKFISIFLTFSLFLLLFIEFFHPINAIIQDLGRHIKTGEIIFNTHSVPKINFFSYTYPDFTFVNTHWLSEVIFYIIFKTSGFHGLLVFTTLIVLFSFAIVFFSSVKQAGIFSAAAVSLLYLGILSERTDLRPEVFSFLFTSIFVSILYRYKSSFTKLIFILPAIELLWVNMHIYFIIGIVLIGLFLFDEIILLLKRLRIKKLERKNLFHKFYLLFFVFILNCLMTLLNPNGLQGAFYPFNVLKNYGYSIQENQNIFFLLNYGQNITIAFFIFSSLLVFICFLINFKKTRLIDWLIAIIFTILACMQIRNFVLFVFATFIPFVYALSCIIQTIFAHNFKQASKSSNANLKTIGLFLFFLFFILWQAYTFISLRGFGWNIPSGAKPAADFFLRNNLQGPIFNNFDIGSYLDFTFYPKEKVFVDGRPEAYPASFFQKIYIPMQNNPEIFSKVDERYGFNTIFLAHTDQTQWSGNFISQIVNNSNWKLIYLDDQIMILVKNNQQNQALIKKFGMDRNSVRINNFQPEKKENLLYLANFFISAGWTNQEEKIDMMILNLDPNNCFFLSRLANIYAQENNASANVYESMHRQVCQ